MPACGSWHPLDKNYVRHRRALPERLRAAVLLARPPRFRAVVGGKFQDDEPLWRPFALERFRPPGAREVSSAILSDRGRRLLDIFRVPDRVGDLDVDDEIGSHPCNDTCGARSVSQRL